MWKSKTRVKSKTDDFRVQVILPEAALTAIFNDCDRFNVDETGGRTIGTLVEENGMLTINVTGIIEAGPQAKRSAVYFLQDGEYQENVFRDVERRHPEIEHLGNWHTHHVNGYPTLSGGDVQTYHRIVNHKNHNIPYFYALLVTKKHNTKDPLKRYSIKHFLFRRGEEDYCEIPASNVQITGASLVWPTSQPYSKQDKHAALTTGAEPNLERAYDSKIIAEFYPDLRPFSSEKLGIYWRGNISLLDRSKIQVVVLEDASGQAPSYSVTLREPPSALKEIAEELGQQTFSSARVALINAERACNYALFHRNGTHKRAI
jgi:hypothetical protein